MLSLLDSSELFLLVVLGCGGMARDWGEVALDGGHESLMLATFCLLASSHAGNGIDAWIIRKLLNVMTFCAFGQTHSAVMLLDQDLIGSPALLLCSRLGWDLIYSF